MKPKYNFFKNSKFAFEGLAAMLKNEAAFRTELCVIVPLAVVSLFLPISTAQHALLIAVFGLVLICECVNTAIEAVVDLVSPGFHPLAKIAKDCASAAVCVSIGTAAITWAWTLFALAFGE